jgi:hypothetical protein
MDYIQASSEHLEAVFTLTQDTVRAVYPGYYPKEVVDYFCSYHSRESIQADIEGGNGLGFVCGRRPCGNWQPQGQPR